MTRVLIVEDQLRLGNSLKDLLALMDYEVVGLVDSFEAAVNYLRKGDLPDIALINIRINGIKDGIDLGAYIQNNCHIPFIFVTAFADDETIDRAKKVKPNGYLVKPFSKEKIHASIQIGLANYHDDKKSNVSDHKSGQDTNPYISDGIFIRDRGEMVKLPYSDIHWLKADGNYTQIVTTKKKYMMRNLLKEFEAKLPFDKFMRVHKSYIVSFSNINAISHQSVTISGERIPMSRSTYDRIMGHINKIGGEPDTY